MLPKYALRLTCSERDRMACPLDHRRILAGFLATADRACKLEFQLRSECRHDQQLQEGREFCAGSKRLPAVMTTRSQGADP
jgi:hypothetical protein